MGSPFEMGAPHFVPKCITPPPKKYVTTFSIIDVTVVHNVVSLLLQIFLMLFSKRY